MVFIGGSEYKYGGAGSKFLGVAKKIGRHIFKCTVKRSNFAVYVKGGNSIEFFKNGVAILSWRVGFFLYELFVCVLGVKLPEIKHDLIILNKNIAFFKARSYIKATAHE